MHVDVHAHAFSEAYVELIARFGASDAALRSARLVLPNASKSGLSKRLATMDESGIERQILSMSAATPYFDDSASSVQAARFLNDELAELCRSHPARFSFFATLPMPHVDASLEELRRSLDELSAAGITFTTSILGRLLTEPAFADVFAELDRRATVVFLHPPGLACASPLIYQSGLAWPLGAPVEDALCALQLMQAGFPRRYPNMKVILPHLAGFLAHLRYRFERSAELIMPNENSPSVQMRQFWYDSSNGEPESLMHAVRAFGIDRILFGSDYPYWIGADYDHGVNFLTMAGLDDHQLEAIQFRNARLLFGEE